jgi:F-box-like
MREDLKRVKEAHELLLAKYQQQFQELEGTQSQIHESKELIKFLRTQCRNFESKNNRLSGILHPIRRCPTDVLQCIFECVWQASDKESRIQTAMCISHVCQRWRTIAIGTPRLWCDVTFSLLQAGSRNPTFWDSLIPRMRRVPANITLLHFDDAGGDRLKQCNLHRIPVISSFVLDLMDPDYFGRIKSLPRFLPKNGVEHLTIKYIPGDEGVPENAFDLKWDIGDFLENSAAVTRLKLNAPCDLIMTPSPKLATVTSLDLANMVNVDILFTISLLPSLAYLELEEVVLTPASETTQVTSNSLKTLQFSGIEHEWLLGLTCPNLDTLLVNSSQLSDSCASFIRVHNLITTLDVCDDNESITTLASIAPQARVLAVAEDLSLLYKRKVPRVRGSPFPNLTQLIIDTFDVAVSLEDFEGIVRARCLPRGHRLSKLTTSLKPLTALSIRSYPSKRVEEAWRDSEFFHSAKKTSEDDACWRGCRLLTLSWV